MEKNIYLSIKNISFDLFCLEKSIGVFKGNCISKRLIYISKFRAWISKFWPFLVLFCFQHNLFDIIKLNLFTVFMLNNHKSPDGRVVKALDLRSNSRMWAWVRSPFLAHFFFLNWNLMHLLIFKILSILFFKYTYF